MDEMQKTMPADVKYEAVYDTTIFVRDSIKAVVSTLLEAIALVVLVVILFLQTWRASIIPLIAVPVSVVGTFAALYLLGFSINTLSLFGLVLAIGIVVDDAIVVVENVERNIEEGLSPTAAAHQAMREVSGPIVAIALVLCAVFVPMAFLSGVTGQFYKQFAVTIAISTVISAINSLTLSPALAARLLKAHGAPKDGPSRLIDRLFGWVFRPFNRFFKSSSEKYERGVARILGRRGAVFVVYAILLVGTGVIFKLVPPGFIPTQDKLYLIAGVKLPEGSSIARTDECCARWPRSPRNRWRGPHHLVPGPERAAVHQYAQYRCGVHSAQALRRASWPYRCADQCRDQPEDRRPAGRLRLRDDAAADPRPGQRQRLPDVHRGPRQPGLRRAAECGAGDAGHRGADAGHGLPDSSYQANVPQLDAEVDRVKAKAQGVQLTELFDTLQTYLGSAYVNDFNQFGRTWQVIAQADGPFRETVEDIGKLRTRNDRGEMVPIGSMVTIKQTFGPDPVLRFNGYPAADLAGEADPRLLSSAEAMTKLTEIAGKVLPVGMTTEWTDLSYQQATQGKPPSSCSRWRSCWPSWCWPRCTRAGRCRWR